VSASPGLLLCRCGHPRRGHDPAGQCLADDLERRFGHPQCGCLRFTGAPFAAQQLSLFEDDTPLLASFHFRDVEVVGRV